MAITLAIKGFGSRIARLAATKGLPRKFNPATGGALVRGGLSTESPWNTFTRVVVGQLKSEFDYIGKFLSWSATKIMQVIHAFKEFIFNFDWNPSDEKLDDDIKEAFESLVAPLGSILGKATGYLLCGALPGVVIYSFNQAMGLHVLQQVGEEALNELIPAFAQLIEATFQAAGVSAFAYAHKQIRTLWRETDDNFKKRLASQGIKKEDVEKALADRNKPFIIRQKLDDKVETIKSKPLRDFIENFLDDFDDTCIEAGYVVAGGIDAFLAQQSVSREVTVGQSSNIEVSFDQNGDISLERYRPPSSSPSNIDSTG